ncbi:ATP-dependent zinc metalloprotease FtsH 3, partial [termite gut metagenome]
MDEKECHILKLDEEQIRKNEILKNAKAVLKEEFVDIDVLDVLFDNIKEWYLMPQLLNRPIVINLWGMTGRGKTHPINRLVELLDYKKYTLYFNFSKIQEEKTIDIEQNIRKDVEYIQIPNSILIYDEFQYAAHYNEQGVEKENGTSGLKTYWELIDPGKFNYKFGSWEFFKIEKTLYVYKKILAECPNVTIKNGKIYHLSEYLYEYNENDLNIIGTIIGISSFFRTYDNPKEKENNKKKVLEFLSQNIINSVIDIISILEKKTVKDDMLYNELNELTETTIIPYFENLLKRMGNGYSVDLSKSLVIVIGNLDSAYTMSYNLNPDMSADQFYKITKEISLMDIKKSLSQMFRKEQLSRLGNIHIIYPSFSSDSFKKIIKLELSQYEKRVYNELKIHLTFDSTMEQIIYDDGVFPTQGTRPIYSTISEMVKNKLPSMIVELAEKEIECQSIEFSYDRENNQTILKSYCDGKVTNIKWYDTVLRVENERKDKLTDEKYLIAVHEAGHAILQCSLMGSVPEKICSTSVDKTIGGFNLFDHDSEKTIYNLINVKNIIAVNLGGMEAERLIYGSKYISNGSTSDINNATVLASKTIRKSGLGKKIAHITSINGDIKGETTFVREHKDTNKEIISMIKDGQ